jgi:hypothetical protein
LSFDIYDELIAHCLQTLILIGKEMGGTGNLPSFLVCWKGQQSIKHDKGEVSLNQGTIIEGRRQLWKWCCVDL